MESMTLEFFFDNKKLHLKYLNRNEQCCHEIKKCNGINKKLYISDYLN